MKFSRNLEGRKVRRGISPIGNILTRERSGWGLRGTRRDGVRERIDREGEKTKEGKRLDQRGQLALS